MRPLICCAAFCVLGLIGCQSPSGAPGATQRTTAPPHPIRVVQISRTHDGQPIRGWVAWVDLTDPRVEIRVTGPAAKEPNDPPQMEVRGETTPHWFDREHLTLAVNTHFFAKVGDPNTPYTTGLPLDIIGPCVSEGVVVSPAPAGELSPGLALTCDKHARVAMLGVKDLDGMDDVVSGVPANAKRVSTLLVDNGHNCSETAAPEPKKRHPRTAAGVSADGRTLILAVIDGRQPAWSIGITLPELAELMIECGARDAINLDGGGSSSFIYTAPDGTRVENKPSDGKWRAVGASMGVYLRNAPGSQPSRN